MQNVRKHIGNTRLVTIDKRRSYLELKPSYHTTQQRGFQKIY